TKLVGNATKQPATDGAHEEASRKNRSRIQQLAGLVLRREKLRCEIKRTEGIDVKIVPLHQITRCAGHDGKDAAARVMGIMCRFDLTIGVSMHFCIVHSENSR